MAAIFPRNWVSSTAAALGLAACILAGPARADDSVYRELGGLPVITAVVDDLLATVYVDPRTAAFFEGVSRKRLHEKLIEQFCSVSGGPCRYTGRSVKDAHKGLGIDQAAFNALVEDLQAAMDKEHVPYHAQNRFLALLAPMSRDVIER
jgi:hemoglobin